MSYLASKAVDFVASYTRPDGLTFSQPFFLPGELEAAWVFLAVAVFSVMIDVTVSPPRFRKMLTSLGRPTPECCLIFLFFPSVCLFLALHYLFLFFFADYCKTLYQVVVAPAMTRILLYFRT